MRLIDADKLKEELCAYKEDLPYYYDEEYDTVKECIKTLDDQPTVNPVKHGKWINDDYDFICSLCRYESPDDSFYCPNCGAKMDEED